MVRFLKNKKDTTEPSREEFWQDTFQIYNINLDISKIKPNSTIIHFPQKNYLHIIEDDGAYAQKVAFSKMDNTEIDTSYSEIKALHKENQLGLTTLAGTEIGTLHKHDLCLIEIKDNGKHFLNTPPTEEEFNAMGIKTIPLDQLD